MTATPGTGYWLNDADVLIEEHVTELVSYVFDDFSDAYLCGFMEITAEYLRDLMDQDSVMYKVNGEVYFFTREDVARIYD